MLVGRQSKSKLMYFYTSNKLGAELKKKKKRIFGPKIGEKFENKIQKLSNLKKKRIRFKS